MSISVPGSAREAASADSDRRGRSGVDTESVRRIVGNSTMNLAAQGLNAFFNVVVVVLLARGIGKEALGAFYTVFALIIVVQVVLELGLSTVLTQRLVQAPATWNETVSEAIGLLIVVALASAAVLVGIGIAWSWLDGDPARVGHFAAAALACAAIQVERFTAAVFRASERFGFENLGRVVQGAIFAALVLALVA